MIPSQSRRELLHQANQLIHDPAVRDLAWAILSTPLLNTPRLSSSTEVQSWQQMLPELPIGNMGDIARFLYAEAQSPLRLQNHLQTQTSHFLGTYFESLWAYFFQHTTDYELTTLNLQVHHQGKTLGEFDLILKHPERPHHIHVELAVKFYLQVNRNKTHTDNLQSDIAWLGPNKIDRLDLKIDSLINKQLRLADEPVARKQLELRGIYELEKRSILRGYIFPEITHPKELVMTDTDIEFSDRLGWLSSDKFAELSLVAQQWQSGHWCAPPKTRWLSLVQVPSKNSHGTAHTLHPQNTPLSQDTLRQVISSINQEQRPKLLVYLTEKPDSGVGSSEGSALHEQFRVFVTPQGWPVNRQE